MSVRNATLQTQSRSGSSISTDLWLDAFTLPDLNLQMASVQIQSGIVWQPIRKQEQSLTFDVVFAARNWAVMDAVSDRLWDHFNYATGATYPVPMTLTYYAINKQYHGWVESAQKGDQKFQSLYKRSFTMRLVNPAPLQVSQVVVSAVYLPTGEDIAGNPDWYQPVITRSPQFLDFMGPIPEAPPYTIQTIQ